MAIISLRAYNREIEGLIDAGQLDEAVAHCRHILTTFPKYIATYRLLGKAHLEQQRISDATDIFQRVLSAVPDDFVANVGMSIIREDENNLDTAIWHMELAYESQPSNAAIQDELRRLYGRRDGMQPPKLRLTRGALARMYTKGGLFDNAVSELRAAIAEDPNRTDLQLVLAQTFFELSQRVEAVELCVNILKKLPYCLAANQVLSVCLPESGEGDAGRNYKQTAISMDPYFAYAGQDAITSEQVPDNAVNLERYEWKSGLQVEDVAAQPTWATSLGISMEKPAEQPIPDWLKEAETPAESFESEPSKSDVTPFLWDNKEVENIISETPKPDEEIPDWLKDAGWKSASEDQELTEEEEPIEQPPAEEPETEELAKAEIPDWLRGLAPEGVLDDQPAEAQLDEKEIAIPWLEKQEPGPTDSIIQWLEGKEPEITAVPPEKTASEPDVVGEEIPEWLKDLDVAYPQREPEETGGMPAVTPAFIEEPVYEEQAPLDDQIEPSITGEQETIEAQALPDESADEIMQPPLAESGEVPDWIKALAAELPTSSTSMDTGGEAALAEPEVQPISDLVGESADVEETPSPAQAFIQDEVAAEELPQTAETPTEEQPAATEEMVAEELPPVEAEQEVELPSMEAEPTAIDESEAEEPQPGEVEQAAELTPVEDEAITTEVELEEKISLSELKAFSEEPAELQEPTITEADQAEEVEPAAAGVEESAWLKDLVKDEDTSEAEFTPPHGTPVEEPLEWVNLDENALAGPAPAEVQPPEDESTAMSEQEIPDWIRGLGEDTAVDESLIEGEPAPAETEMVELEPVETFTTEAEIPPSLRGDIEPPQDEAALVSEPGEITGGIDDELPDWIRDMAASAPVSELTPWEETTTAETEAQEAGELAPGTVEPTLEMATGETEGVIPSQEEVEEPLPEVGEPALEWVPSEHGEADISQEEAEESLPEVPAWVMDVLKAEEQETVSVDELPFEAMKESMEPPADAGEIPPAFIGEEMAAAEAGQPEPELASLEQARSAVSQGLPDQASELYINLVRKNYHLDELISDLQEASYRFPVEVKLQVALGDAYFRKGEAQEALNAYTRAEELVR